MVNITPRLCLLFILLVTVFFWYRSVQVREPWNVPTFLKISNWLEHHQHITAKHLAYVNNWLDEGPSTLYFGQYMYPRSVELPTLAYRKLHPSYPPMITFGLYTLFKTLEVTGIVPDIYYQRGLQILIVIWLNHIFHLILALSMCLLVFVLTRNLGFDNINSSLMAITPSIVLFHNAGTLYWYNHLFIAPVIIVPLFTTYILLELLRLSNPSPRLLKTIKIGQPVLMFSGVFMGWLFPFVIAVVYASRLVQKEIALPWSRFFSWAKQTFLFCWPALVALGVWVWTIALYQQNTIVENFFEAPTSAMGNTITHNFLHKAGIVDFQGNLASFEEKLFWYSKAFYEHISNDLGLIAFLLILGAIYLAVQSIRQTGVNIASLACLLLFAPVAFYGLVLTVDDANHYFTSVKYSVILSIIFVLIPVFVLKLRKKDILMPAMRLTNGKSIALVTVIAVFSSSLWAYTQVYSQERVTRLFTNPETHHLAIGNFISKNSDYHDVVFSNDYFFPHQAAVIYSHFTKKIMHFADSLDTVYRKTRHVTEKFTVKIFYYQRSKKEVVQLRNFLESQQLTTSVTEHLQLGGLLVFDGQQFLVWYKQNYCNEHPESVDFC